MPIVLTVNAVTYNTVTFGLAGEAADGTNELQLSSRGDFQFAPSPIYTGWALGTPGLVERLNQDTTYYARVRGRRASGLYEDWSNVVAFRTPVNVAQNLAPPSLFTEPATLFVPVTPLAWTSPHALAGFPPSNLSYDAPVAYMARSGATNLDFQVQIAPEPVDTFAILNTNMPEDGTIRIRGGNDGVNWLYDLGTVPFRASPNVPGRPGYHGLVRLPAPQTYPHWWFRLSAETPRRIFYVEHLIMGLNRVSKRHSLEKTETGFDLGSLERNRSGSPNRVYGARMRRVDFDLSLMTEAQYETQYADLHWRVGGTDPVFVAPNSKTGAFLHDRMLYGAISAGRVTYPASGRFTRNFTIDSLI